MICNGRDVIRAGYAAGKPVSEIATECDSTPGSVRVIAHLMGLRHPRKFHLNIPAERREDYRALLDFGKFTALEAAALLGLEVRP